MINEKRAANARTSRQISKFITMQEQCSLKNTKYQEISDISAVSQAMIKFLKVQMGEETETVIAKVMGDIVIVRIKCILPLAEKHMVRNQQGQRPIKDLKERLIEKAKPLLEAIIKDLTDVKSKEERYYDRMSYVKIFSGYHSRRILSGRASYHSIRDSCWASFC